MNPETSGERGTDRLHRTKAKAKAEAEAEAEQDTAVVDTNRNACLTYFLAALYAAKCLSTRSRKGPWVGAQPVARVSFLADSTIVRSHICEKPSVSASAVEVLRPAALAVAVKTCRRAHGGDKKRKGEAGRPNEKKRGELFLWRHEAALEFQAVSRPLSPVRFCAPESARERARTRAGSQCADLLVRGARVVGDVEDLPGDRAAGRLCGGGKGCGEVVDVHEAPHLVPAALDHHHPRLGVRLEGHRGQVVPAGATCKGGRGNTMNSGKTKMIRKTTNQGFHRQADWQTDVP